MYGTRHERFPMTVQAPSRARRWAEEAISLEPDARAAVILLLSELVANSVRHSGCPPEDWVAVEIRQDAHRVHVEVRDPGPGDGIRPNGLLQHSGLRIVEAMADHWGVRRDPTTVWFEVSSPRIG